MMDVKLKVKGMHCRSCEMLLSDALSEIPGTSNIKVDHKNSLVAFNAADAAVVPKVIEAIKKEGYSAE